MSASRAPQILLVPLEGVPDRDKRPEIRSILVCVMDLGWGPLLTDFILVAQGLERLGFTYFKGKVTIIELK